MADQLFGGYAVPCVQMYKCSSTIARGIMGGVGCQNIPRVVDSSVTPS